MPGTLKFVIYLPGWFLASSDLSMASILDLSETNLVDCRQVQSWSLTNTVGFQQTYNSADDQPSLFLKRYEPINQPSEFPTSYNSVVDQLGWLQTSYNSVVDQPSWLPTNYDFVFLR